MSLRTADMNTPAAKLEPRPNMRNLSLQDVLGASAASNKGSIICYSPGTISAPTQSSYQELCSQSSHYSQIVRSLPGFDEGQPVLLHLDEHWDTLVWFWAILLAKGLPVLSSPLSAIEDQRHKHLKGLSTLLQEPICITSKKLLDLFNGAKNLLRLHTIESLDLIQMDPRQYGSAECAGSNPGSHANHSGYEKGDDLAMLMLTSGSTGNAKAVRLSHRQVLAAISGKASVRQLQRGGAFLNWIGLDHVASLIEIHIQAMWLGVSQIHVHAADVVSSPHVFLDLLTRHHVCRTFAPNFFLGRLVSTVLEEDDKDWDLTQLQVVASGGEANDVKTCIAASSLFERYGAPRNVITPGFGMTETCAGAIFNLACPDYDAARGHIVASLGKCMTGIEMRIVVDSRLASLEEIGNLEVRGDVVFDGYYRNPGATANAFPSRDGWFRTGDQGGIDLGGNLRLIGRKKDVININGIKIIVSDVESLLEQALGDMITRFVVFPTRAIHTEQITVAYVPGRSPHTAEGMIKIDELAAKICLTSFSARPLVFSLKKTSIPLVPTSTLGKISRAKMSSMFESGVFEADLALHRQTINAYIRENQRSVSTATDAEALLINDFTKTLSTENNEICPETRIFELGLTSMALIGLKRRIDTRLGIAVPIITLINNPTARSLALALDYELWKTAHGQAEQVVKEYNPVVTLEPDGTRAPLWLVHPGVGEVLVFIALAQHLKDDDRPVYALRARGFEDGQTQFSSITETVETYVQAIRRRQPHGPYALAGYSYGAMLAFEITKRLDTINGVSATSSVQFLGSFNLPPHIKSRMRELRWNLCLLHLTQFLGLTSEDDVEAMEQSSGFPIKSRSEALTQIMGATDRSRLTELGLEQAALARWADVAYGLQSLAVEYEPSGEVSGIDVFHAIPLKRAAASREEWVNEHLSKWRDFSQTEPRFHEVGGAHYTMIGPEHVTGFAAKLKEALHTRGL
jgi:acyl-CoA synthetase (AMP-forming)/AMP-acid ligase II/thioesterase domain-containing protein